MISTLFGPQNIKLCEHIFFFIYNKLEGLFSNKYCIQLDLLKNEL